MQYQDVLNNPNHENGKKRIKSLLQAFCDRCFDIAKVDACLVLKLNARGG